MNNFKDHINNFIDSCSLENIFISQSIIDIFCDSERVIFCTMGKSAFACRKIVYTARSFNLDWHDLDVCHAFHGDIGLVRDNDLLVFVSKSGETRETILVASKMKNHKKISITSSNDGSGSTLDKLCDENIRILLPNGEGSPFGMSPMNSTTMYMLVLHGVLCEVIKSNGIEESSFHKNHPNGEIGKKLEEKFRCIDE